MLQESKGFLFLIGWLTLEVDLLMALRFSVKNNIHSWKEFFVKARLLKLN